MAAVRGSARRLAAWPARGDAGGRRVSGARPSRRSPRRASRPRPADARSNVACRRSTEPSEPRIRTALVDPRARLAVGVRLGRDCGRRGVLHPGSRKTSACLLSVPVAPQRSWGADSARQRREPRLDLDLGLLVHRTGDPARLRPSRRQRRAKPRTPFLDETRTAPPPSSVNSPVNIAVVRVAAPFGCGGEPLGASGTQDGSGRHESDGDWATGLPGGRTRTVEVGARHASVTPKAYGSGCATADVEKGRSLRHPGVEPAPRPYKGRVLAVDTTEASVVRSSLERARRVATIGASP